MHNDFTVFQVAKIRELDHDYGTHHEQQWLTSLPLPSLDNPRKPGPIMLLVAGEGRSLIGYKVGQNRVLRVITAE